MVMPPKKVWRGWLQRKNRFRGGAAEFIWGCAVLNVLMGHQGRGESLERMSGAVVYSRPPYGLATESHLLFSRHHLASLPLCLPKEFMASSPLTSYPLPSLPWPRQCYFLQESFLDLLRQKRSLFPLGSHNTLYKPALSSSSHPV